MLRCSIVFACLLSICGCTHHQLRFNTVNSARTVGDIQTKVVLDNLAKFAANPGALPHFTYPQAGSASVTDSFGGSEGQNFNPFRLTSWTFGMTAGRTHLENYTLSPINDPRKLELMRCAYQQAVQGKCRCQIVDGCSNCRLRMNRFYLGAELPRSIPQATYDGKPLAALFPVGTDMDADLANVSFIQVYEDTDQFGEVIVRYADDGTQVAASELQLAKTEKRLKPLFETDSLEHLTQRTGRVTIESVNSRWFKVVEGRSADCLDSCGLVGRYCDTTIVVPECHRDQLTKLTLVILDIAFNDAAEVKVETPPTREVVASLNAFGKLAATKDEAVLTVKQVVPTSVDLTSLFEQTPTETVVKGGTATGPLTIENPSQGVPEVTVRTAPSNSLKDLLNGTLGNPGTGRSKIIQRPTETPGTNLLNDNLRLNTLAPFN